MLPPLDIELGFILDKGCIEPLLGFGEFDIPLVSRLNTSLTVVEELTVITLLLGGLIGSLVSVDTLSVLLVLGKMREVDIVLDPLHMLVRVEPICALDEPEFKLTDVATRLLVVGDCPALRGQVGRRLDELFGRTHELWAVRGRRCKVELGGGMESQIDDCEIVANEFDEIPSTSSACGTCRLTLLIIP